MSAGRKRQTDIYIAGMSGVKPQIPVDMTRLEKDAAAHMSPQGYAYIAGGAGTESTIDANRAAFERWRIVPRMLRDTTGRDTSVTLFGRRLDVPILLAPIGVLEMAHRDADKAVAKAAAAENIPMIFSNQASVSMEECAAVMGDSPRWFQLYWSTMDDLVQSFLQRAERAGCEAIVLTLDTTWLGWRIRDLDLGYLPFLLGKGIAQYTSDPVFIEAITNPAKSELDSTKRKVTPSLIMNALRLLRAYPDRFLTNARSGLPMKAVRQFIGTYSRPSLKWDDLAQLREMTTLPIVLKGILHPDDARLAIDHGADGIIVSNHGGRQVDGAIGAFDALPAVVDAVAGQIPVLMDSGIRSGADIFKALAMGATAVCIGRPYAYGLAVAGETGVREVIQNFKADLDLTMGLSGCTSLSEIDRQMLVKIP